MTIRIERIYEDSVENLLDQYTSQLQYYENEFYKKHEDLNPLDYMMLHEEDPIINEIMSVIAQIYDTNIPIMLKITDSENLEKPKKPH